MTPDFFLKGAVIGFAIAAPVGPIGVLCLRRSLADGPAMGFLAGLGAATADAAYGAVAAFGLTTVSGFLERQQVWLAPLGGAFLCWLGARTFRSRPAAQAASTGGGNGWTTYASTLLLTLTNPATIFSFLAVFTGLGLGASPDYWTASLLMLGVFCGSALWWLILSTGAGMLRSRMTQAWMQWVNRLSGCVLGGFGLYALARLLFQ